MKHLHVQACGTQLHYDPLVQAECDPLDGDHVDDVHLPVSRRGLVRLALVASEVGARFQREGTAHDPMAWMLASRRLFSGGTAIEACLELDGCLRAVMLHGLGFGVDASPEDIDDLISDDDDLLEDGDVLDGPLGEDHAADGGRASAEAIGPRLVAVEGRLTAPRLFTATAVDETDDGITQAFEALVATDANDLRACLRSRYGARIADLAEIREGFDHTSHIVQALVSPAMTDMLVHVAGDPGSPLARGLEVAISQKFAE